MGNGKWEMGNGTKIRLLGQNKGSDGSLFSPLFIVMKKMRWLLPFTFAIGDSKHT